MSELAISLRGVSKCFKRYQKPVDRLKDLLLPGKNRSTECWAVRNIDLDIPKGQTFGIVGRNGSGKSTLLQIIVKTLMPTTGDVKVNGRVSALLELGSGFNPEFTGRQNVFFNGRLLGLSQSEIEEKFDSIAAFAEIGDFIEQPVKTYSSGMFVRLAFAVASSVDPDILVVDEALSVGDEAFQRKCYARIQSIQERGGTILFVSHSATSVIELCDTAVLMDRGEALLYANPKLVVSNYQKLLYAPPENVEGLRQQIRKLHSDDASAQLDSSVSLNNLSTKQADLSCLKSPLYDPNMVPKSTISYISLGAKIANPHVLTLSGERANILSRRQEYFYTYSVKFSEPARNVRFGMLIKTITGLEIGGAASHTPDNAIPHVEAGSVLQVKFRFSCFLQPGVYFLNAGVLGTIDEAEVFLHRCVDIAMFRVQQEKNMLETALIDFQTEASVSAAQPQPIPLSESAALEHSIESVVSSLVAS